MTGSYYYTIPDVLVSKIVVKNGMKYHLLDHVKEWLDEVEIHSYKVDWHGTQVNEDYLHETVDIEFENEADLMLFKLKWE